MNNTPPQVLPPQVTPPVNPIVPGSIEDILGVANDKVTLGRMIQAIIKLDSEIPSEGGSIIKMIRTASTDYNLGLDFITTKEQDKLKAFDINGVDPLAPPIELAQMTSLASEFDQLQAVLNGSAAGQIGLIDEFFTMNQTVAVNTQNISVLQSNPVLSGKEFTQNEKTAVSIFNNKFLNKTGIGNPISLDSDVINAIKAAGFGTGSGTPGNPGSGSGISQADQDKLNFISVTKAVDLDVIDQTELNSFRTKLAMIDVSAQVDLDQMVVKQDSQYTEIPLIKDKTDNLEIVPAMPMLPATTTTLENIKTSKDIQLAQKQILPTDDIDKAGDNRLITVANALGAVKALGLGIDNAFEQIEEALTFAFKAGTTAVRPTDADGMGPVSVGQQYFDTTLGKPIWCKTATVRTPGVTPPDGDPGTQVWVDATGATV